MTHRYLVAYLSARRPHRKALLRFPLGVTLEDAGHDSMSLLTGDPEPTLPEDTLDRLSGLGVETVAVGPEAVDRALQRARAPRSSLDAFVEDYLDVNARLGGEQCVTVDEYSMWTSVGRTGLSMALSHRLRRMRDVRVYGEVAFRTHSLPRLLRLRLWNIAINELPTTTRVHVPCRLHGDGCRGYYIHKYCPGLAITSCVRGCLLDTRVAVPRRLLDDLDHRNSLRIARAAREVARLVLDALPDDAWSDGLPSMDMLPMVAVATAQTCEEYRMIKASLLRCRSAREMVRRSRDASWAVSRALEMLHDTE